MKTLTKFFWLSLLTAVAVLVLPRHAMAGIPLENVDDPAYAYAVSSGSLLNISGTSPSSASTVAGTASPNLRLFKNLEIVATLQGGTGGTLDVYIQSSPDGGTTWVDYIHFPQLAAGAAAVNYHVTVGRDSGQSATPSVVGTGLTPALAANTVVGGSFGTAIRAVFKAGASTTAGATQTIQVYAGL